MDRRGLDYREIDIEADPHTAAVQRINAGSQTVPTVVLPSGLAMTNPALHQIVDALQRLSLVAGQVDPRMVSSGSMFGDPASTIRRTG